MIRAECESCGEVRDLYADDDESLCLECIDMKEHERQIDQRLQRDMALANADRDAKIRRKAK
ncbi:MAG TPA: hypothetical protein PK948_08190 [Gemmatimonadales bacterium]|nr:hypothetical protein [Gemmatimonadales bacterium]